jgi:23S rRNA (guanosine2251-2'-O)-methyltransferase
LAQRIFDETVSKNQNIVFGVNPVLEKLKASSDDILEILIAESSEGQALRQIAHEAKQRGLRLVPVQARVLDRLTGGYRHQGVVAKVEPYRYLSLDQLLQQASTESPTNWILVLDGITDPRNFGALLRTAEAVGVSHVVIAKDRSAEVTPLVVKASAGATHHLQVTMVTNIRRAIGELKNRGYWIVGLDGQSPKSIFDMNFPNRLVIVLGGEGKGLRPVTLRECDFVLSIPMLGKIASLNVAVAGAVFMYELVRQSQNNIDKGLSKR